MDVAGMGANFWHLADNDKYDDNIILQLPFMFLTLNQWPCCILSGEPHKRWTLKWYFISYSDIAIWVINVIDSDLFDYLNLWKLLKCMILFTIYLFICNTDRVSPIWSLPLLPTWWSWLVALNVTGGGFCKLPYDVYCSRCWWCFFCLFWFGFIWTLAQINMWNESCGFGKHSIQGVRLASDLLGLPS